MRDEGSLPREFGSPQQVVVELADTVADDHLSGRLMRGGAHLGVGQRLAARHRLKVDPLGIGEPVQATELK